MTRAVGRLSILVVALFIAGASDAQNAPVHNGKLTGAVTDPAGASFPNARVLLVDLTSLEMQTVEAPLDGRFVFSNLKAGRYAVIAVPPKDPETSDCWQPAVSQLTLREDVLATVQLKLLVDSTKCKVVDDLEVR